MIGLEMQRKNRTESSNMPEKMPFMTKHNRIPVAQMFPMNALDAAKAALPIFGGTPEDESKTESSSSNESQSSTSESSQTGASSASTAGGDSGQPKEMSPEQIADLLRQVGDLTNSVTKLTTENNNYKAQEQQKQREGMGREQALEADLQDAQQTIVKMDQALKHQAVINAINGFKDVEFHDPKFVIRELSADVFENMEVDLENSTVTVSGIENELRRIAREKDWAVKKNNRPDQQNGNQQQRSNTRSTGAPPPPPNGNNDKASRREALINKFPVIGAGRAPIR
jgi:hypothetical protein